LNVVEHLRLLAAAVLVAALAGSPLPSVSGGTALQAPETVDSGQEVAVAVTGGHADGRVEVWGPYTGLTTGQGGALVSTQPAGTGEITVTAPDEAGTYELRYLDGAGNVLATATVEVAAMPVLLSLPEPLGAGYDAPVRWRGPGAEGDMIQVFDPASGQVVAEVPAIGHPRALNTTMVRMPESRGAVEIRYWRGTRQVALRVMGATVGDGIGLLRSPVEVVVNSAFTVEWTGPAGPDQVYQLVDPKTGAVLTEVPAVNASGVAHPARMIAPAKPGDYRVRFVNTGSGFAVADLPLDVDPN
jgi:Ca-activated chloride channel family protein